MTRAAVDLNDPAEFARRVLRLPAYPYQEPALRSAAPVVALRGGRRSGKSLVAQVRAIHVAATNRNSQVVQIWPNVENGRRGMAETTALIRRSPALAGCVVDELGGTVRFDNGSEILVVPATPGQARGFGRRVLLVVLEEAGFLPASIVRDVRYALLDRHAEGAQMWLVGSPWGGPEHPFRDAQVRADEGDADYAAFRFRTADNPLLPASFVERERSRISPAEAAAELDGDWTEAVGSLFSRDLLDRQTADLALPAVPDLRPPARGIVGLDWGVSFDRSAAVALFRLPVATLNADDEWLPRFVAIPDVRPLAEPLHDTVERVVQAAAALHVWCPESVGVGAGGTEAIGRALRRISERDGTSFKVNAVHTTAAKKTAAYGTLLTLLERGQLVLPRDPDLLRQLAGLRFEQRARGFLRIEAEDAAQHDDCADALALATVPRTDRRGNVICQLARFADEELAPPDADLPKGFDGGDVVTTGGGLKVWRRPTFQSYAARQVTFPAGAEPASKEPPRLGGFTIRPRRIR